jgi:hypothetical protein
VENISLVPFTNLARQPRDQINDTHKFADSTQGGTVVTLGFGFLLNPASIVFQTFQLVEEPVRMRRLRGISGF